MRGPHCSLILELKHRMQFRADFHAPNQTVSIGYNSASGLHSCELYSFALKTILEVKIDYFDRNLCFFPQSCVHSGAIHYNSCSSYKE